MQFNSTNLGNGFKHAIDWMLQGGFSEEIKTWLKTYEQQRNDLSSNADAESALRLLLYTKVTNGLAREMSPAKKGGFDSEVTSFLAKHNQNLRTSQAMAELADLIEKYSVFGITKEKGNAWVTELLVEYPTLRDFTEEQYRLRKKGEKSLLGEKGTDHYLRDFGRFDIAPIDLHEKRFLVRTGIFHAFSVQGKQDPLDYGCLQDALSTFCLFCLQGETFGGIDLDSAPGVVDLFIWFYCAQNKYDICGSTPKCEGCQLNDACLYGLASIQNAIANGQTMQEYGLTGGKIQQLLQRVQRSRPPKTERIDWRSIRKSAQEDPDGLALSLRQYGMNRSDARRLLTKAGLKPDQIDRYYP